MSESLFNLATVLEDAKKVITNPVGFYKEMPTAGGYIEPLIFVLVMGFISGLIISLYSLLHLSSFNALIGGRATLAMVIMMPIMALIGSFIGAAFLFVIWKLMGSEKNYECAYRSVAYSLAIAPVIALISFIPYLAGVIKTLWSCFLMMVASIEVHKVKANIAKITFGVFAVLGVTFGVGSERTARHIHKQFDNISTDAIKQIEQIGEMTPEEAGKQFGKFMKGVEEFQKGMEQEKAQ